MSWLTNTFYLLSGISLLIFLPLFPKVKFAPFEINSFDPRIENTIKNHELTQVEHLFEGEIKGPEAFEVYNGKLFTSAHGGLVYEVLPDQLKAVVKVGKPCESFVDEKNCGRPLGLKFNTKGELFIADAYYGIFKANVSTGESEVIISVDQAIDGKKPMIPNSLAVASDGTIYWTDSSTADYLQDGFLTTLANGNGRVIKWDPVTKKNTVILDEVHFPNGIILSPDEEMLFVAETMRQRIIRIELQGEDAYKPFTHLDGLAGMPDNLHVLEDKTFCASMIVSYRHSFNTVQWMASHSWLRKLLYVTFSSIDNLFYYLNEYFPSHFFKACNHWINHFESMNFATPRGAEVIIFDDKSNILERFYCYDGSVDHVSDFIEFNGYYYFGSPFHNYLGRKKV